MRRCAGVGASPGIGVGVAHYLGGRVEVHQRRILPQDVETEVRRFEEALARADAQLTGLQRQLAARELNGQSYQILEAHRMMLTDVHLVEETRRIVREERVGAEWAVRKALEQIQAVLGRVEDPYFRDRRSDVDMVGEYIIRNLMGIEVSAHETVPQGALVFAHDVSPADITQLARVGVAGLLHRRRRQDLPFGGSGARLRPALRGGVAGLPPSHPARVPR